MTDKTKPNAYAITDPTGRMFINTVRSSRDKSWDAFQVHKEPAQKAGYRCVPVTVAKGGTNDDNE